MNYPSLPSKVSSRIDSVVISSCICIFILLGFIQTSNQFLHWFVIPVTLSGIVIGIDAVNWLRGRMNIFDPIGILGLLGFHFFFVAPLLHVSWDFWLRYVSLPPDWRPWLGGMAALNFLGILVYRAVRSLGSSSPISPSTRTIWTINRQNFSVILLAFLAISAVLQGLVYQKFGGLGGYIATATDETISQQMFSGLGPLFMFSESFPILAMIGFSIYAKDKKSWKSLLVLLLVLAIFLIFRLLFGGLRGSRSNTIWAIFWALGMIHFWIRPISKQIIAFGLAFLLSFMYLYGFYKTGGLEGVQTALESQDARAGLEETQGRSWKSLLLQDLGRSDTQAFVLYRLTKPDSDYDYAEGRTYLAALASLVPRQIWSDKPPDKVKEGTEALYGKGSYIPVISESSKVYGLAGEAMLNFGPAAVPAFFAVLGIVVGYVRRCLLTWHPSDTRLLLLPMLVNFCFVILVNDLDNNIFFLFKQGGFPLLFVLITSKRYTYLLPPSFKLR